MKYKKIDLFGNKKSKGTFDDIYDARKYDNIMQCYDDKDFVKCNFVQDEEGILYVEAYHAQKPNKKKRHRLIIQKPFAGIDAQDDELAVRMAVSLLN